MLFKPTLSSKERIKSRKQIKYLFGHGEVLFKHPFKVYVHIDYDTSEPISMKMGVSVPKSKHKKAVSRNRLKRKVKEAYRLRKPAFLEANKDKQVSIQWFFIFIDKEPNESLMGASLDLLFDQLAQKLNPQ